MKSLIKNKPRRPQPKNATPTAAPASPSQRNDQAQCCAKISRSTAGCHD